MKQFRPRLNKIQHKLIKAMKGDNEVKSYIVTGCNHVPFNNFVLTNGMLDLMSVYKYDGLILAGDFLDMSSLGEYERGKINNTGVTLYDEYRAGNKLLDKFDAKLNKDAEKVFLFGNHEDRYWRWRADVNNSKLGDVLNPIIELNLKERGYIVKDDYKHDYYRLGSLQVMHGEYFNVHSAKKHLDVFRRNVLYFHTHRVQVHREGDFCSWNCGTMADLDSPCFNYAKRGMKMQWANGFAIVHVNVDGSHFVELINCVDNKFIYSGVVYGRD